MNITRPNTPNLYFTAYLINFSYNSKTKCDKKKKEFENIEKRKTTFLYMCIKYHTFTIHLNMLS